MVKLDSRPDVIAWSSEEVIIPYVCRTDGKTHRYYMDFWVKIKTKSGEIKESLIEVKPYNQTIKPEYKGGSKKAYNKKAYKYLKNYSKWEAAEKYCQQRGLAFHILTEKELGLEESKLPKLRKRKPKKK